MFVALDKALLARLRGYPLDKSGNPTSPQTSPGVRIPVYTTRTNDIRTEGFQPFEVVPGKWRQVPIYKTEVTGVVHQQVYPCVTYAFVGMEPRLDQWLPPIRANQIQQTGQGDLVTVQNAAGELIGEGYRDNAYNPFPESYDVMVQFDIYSQIEYEAFQILHAMMLLFPQKGCIAVPQANGTSHNCDMLMQESVRFGNPMPPDLQNPGGSQDDFREHRFTLTYNVEAYLDTTWPHMTQTVPAVTAIDLQMAQFNDKTDAATVSGTTDVLETKVVTTKTT